MKSALPPLAERLRPTTLDELTGQAHLTGKGSILRTAIEQGKVPSIILWGPPGVGKTTIANIIAHTLQVPFYTLSAISSQSTAEAPAPTMIRFPVSTRFTLLLLCVGSVTAR